MEIKTLIEEKSSKSRDPYVLYYNNSYYYCFSRDDKIYLSVSKELDLLYKAKEIVAYKNEAGLKNLWAPELHIIDNKCYIYVACDDENNENHRMYVLYNNSDDPLLEYENNGIISDVSNKWAIDGTILNYKNELYFVWSGCDGDIHFKQEIFIAKMNNPFEIGSKKVLLSTPEYDWEKCGGDGVNLAFVNEGPAIIRVSGKTYIIYSASGCWCENYCLGMLELVGDDVLSKDSWKKYDKPIFSNINGLIGPGHCSFIIKDDNEGYMFFHSFNDKENLNLENVNARYIKFNLYSKKIIYKNTFENIKTLNCNFPVEDQYYFSENEAIIADGITRDPIGIKDLSKYSFQEFLDKYPRPSGAELAAKEIVNTFSKTNGSLKDKLIKCNESVKKLNDDYISNCDYLENDYYGAVASCMRIENNILDYAYICDCGLIVYDKDGNIKFQTRDDKELDSDPYINQIGIPWNLPEARVIVRRDFRNNLDNIKDGKCVSYGALTGEKSATEFIRFGQLELTDGDIIILYSDGFTKFLHEEEFISQILNFNKEKFECYVDEKASDDYEKYGKEKTLALFKN